MPTTEEILNKIKTSEKKAPVGAFATEIDSNADVVGNLNSQFLYNQTPEKDNGLQKMANKYLEKVASMAAIKSWPKRLYHDIAGASPLAQIGIASGAVVGTSKVIDTLEQAKANIERKRSERKSLHALNSIKKTLDNAVVVVPQPTAKSL
jgi:hypothetical protein